MRSSYVVFRRGSKLQLTFDRATAVWREVNGKERGVFRSAIFPTGVWRHQSPLTGDYGGKP